MSYTFELKTTGRLVDGNNKAVSEVIGDVTRRVVCAGEEIFDARAVVADNYTRLVMWQDGDSGVGDFDVLVCESDKDILLELTIDRAGTPLYSVVPVVANIPYIRAADDMVAAVLTNGSLTTLDAIDQIAVKRNVADVVADANVRLRLFT